MQIQLFILRTTCSEICQISVFFVALLCIMNSSLFEIFLVCTCFQTNFFVYVRVSIISIISTFVYVSIYTKHGTQYMKHEDFVYQLVNSNRNTIYQYTCFIIMLNIKLTVLFTVYTEFSLIF